MRKMILVGVVVVLLLVSVACSAGRGNVTSSKDSPQTTRPAATYTSAPQTSTPNYAPPTATKPAGNDVSTTDWGTVYTPDQILAAERMVIRNGKMQMVVDSIAAAMDNITRIASAYNGYVVNSQKWKEGDRNIGNISIRIQAENYEKAMTDLRAQAKSITSETTSSQDVTEEYVDLESKVKNLEATESQLLKVMTGATLTEDILSIQRELTVVRGEIEQAKGRMLFLQRTSATSLIEVRLEEAVIAVKFTAGKVSSSTDEAIQFTSEVTGGFAPYNFQWDFGDGQTSTERSPYHAYKDAGTYPVSLRVTDDKGYSNTMSRNAYINIVSSWKPGSVASTAWNGLATFGKALVNVLIWLGIFSPVWLIIGGVIWFVIYRSRKKSRAL